MIILKNSPIRKVIKNINKTLDNTLVTGLSKSPKQYRDQGRIFRGSIEVDIKTTKEIPKSGEGNKDINTLEDDRTS